MKRYPVGEAYSHMLRSIHESIRFMNRMHPKHEYYFIHGSDVFIARTHPIHESDLAIIFLILGRYALYSGLEPCIMAYISCNQAYKPRSPTYMPYI